MSQSDEQGTPTQVKPLLSNKWYDVLNALVLVILPAVATFYFALSGIWGLPYGEQVVGTITALALFLGALVKVSNRSYTASNAKYDGMVLTSSDPTKPPSMEFWIPVENFGMQKEISLKVVQRP